MKREKCRQCGNTLVHIEGRRPKEFCTDACRIKFYYANKPKIQVKDLTKKTDVKSITAPKPTTNYYIDTTKKVEIKLSVEGVVPVFKNDVERMFWEEQQKRVTNKKQ